MRTRRKTPRMLLGLVAAVALFAGTAFTASNTMPTETHAGTGTVAISGYTATDISYTLGADKSTVDQVDITITGAVTDGSEASLRLETDGAWYGCTIGEYNTTAETTPLICDTTTPAASVETANNLTLVIAD